MIEPEIAFADLSDDADLAERFLKHIFDYVLHERLDDLKFFEQTASSEGRHRAPEKFLEASFERMTYTRGDRDPAEAPRRSSTTRRSGAWTCRPSTSASSPRSTSAGRWWS
jgi:hypothetical protein